MEQLHKLVNKTRKAFTRIVGGGKEDPVRTGPKPGVPEQEYVPSTEELLQRARAAWFREMAPLSINSEVIKLPNPVPSLQEIHVHNCRLLPERSFILEKMKKGGVVAEVGVQEGNFSRKILSICQPQKLHLLDMFLDHFHIPEKFRKETEQGIVSLHEGDSSSILSTFPDQYFDFLYIDADHSYRGVKRDIEVAKKKVKDDGYLVFNDYTFWSPVECMPYGVIQGVNELCVQDNWEIIYYALADYMYCDVAVKKIVKN